MARRHRMIKASPAAVWTVLADGSRYVDWVVGTSSSQPVSGRWPAVGAAIEYEVPLGPVRLHNETVVRYCEPGTLLELEAKAGFLGTARISLQLRPWGERCLVTVDEHPLHGAAGTLHNFGAEAVIQLRHRAMLARLARVCEAEQAHPKNGDGPATAGSGARHHASGEGHA
ncbi:SRPBCC family protein [Streptomyces sp. NPDC102467]|uniref:SRPBCC family protein n=1 Tax=Streptomyces sp. NPDC102467 TaxID=3366179 RepID=UPI0037FF64AA